MEGEGRVSKVYKQRWKGKNSLDMLQEERKKIQETFEKLRQYRIFYDRVFLFPCEELQELRINIYTQITQECADLQNKLDEITIKHTSN